MDVRTRILRSPLVLVTSGIILALLLAAIFAPLVAPHDPLKTHAGYSYAKPSRQFPFGNDHFGRDILSRVIYGTRLSFTVSFTSTAISLVVGVMLGITAGYYGGRIDTLIMRSIDVLLAFPTILLALFAIAVLGASMTNLIGIIGLLGVPRYARLSYSSTHGVKNMEFVEAARSIGVPDWRILLFAILPNIPAPLFVQTALRLGGAIMSESGLSFLGMGVPPPAPSWGRMIAEGRGLLDAQPLMVVWPSLALAISVLSFNLLGNGLRDALDPRLRKA